MRYRLYLILASLTLLFSAIELHAQWKNVAPNLLNFNRRGGIEEGYGALHYKDGILWAGWEELWFSRDTGKTWTKTALSKLSVVNNTPISRIQNISFLDRFSGIVCAESGVFKTLDGGTTWTRANFPGYTLAGFYLSTQNIISFKDKSNSVSTDGGLSWEKSTFPRAILAMFKVAKDGTVYGLGIRENPPFKASDFIFKSTDGGRTWLPQSTSPLDTTGSTDSYSLDIDSCDSKRLYVANEDFWSPLPFINEISEIFYSSDLGATWNVGFSHPGKYISGSLSVASNSIYAQTIYDGILRSTDQGVTWKNIGGPGNVADSRSVCAINDNIIFAFDSMGSIWATFNSGGDSLPNYSMESPSIITSDQSNDTIGGSVFVPITLQGLSQVRDIDLVLHYDPELLYQGSVSPGGIPLDIPKEQWAGRSKLHIPNVVNDAVVGYSHFIVFADSLRKPQVWFDSLGVVNTSLSPCATRSISVCTITPPQGCGVNILSKFIRTGKMPEFTIRPNPAENEILIECTENVSIAHIDIYDLMGRVYLGQSIDITQGKPNTLDVRSLPTGSYYLRIDAGGLIRTHPLVISR